MTVQLTHVPEAPEAGDSITITVTGAVPDPSTVVITGEQTMISPVFTQKDLPDGTGPDAYTLEIVDATEGDFTLTIYEWGDGDNAVETDPIYYFADEEYTYPDSGDVATALEEALPGVSVTVTRSGPVLTLLFGGDYSGKKVELLGDATGLTGGTPAVTIEDTPAHGGPFVWGPLMLNSGSYSIDVLDDEDASLIDAPVEIVVA